MKTQISGQHIDTIGVQPPTILNTKFSPGLLSRAFFILLLIATTVATGAAQSIYVSNIVQFGSGSLAYINEYGPDGTLVNDDMLVFGGGREVTGLAWSAGSLFVPILNTGFSDTVNKYNANTAATDLLFHFNAGSVTNPQGAAVFGNLLFIATNGVTGVYNATTGAQITLLGGVLFPQYVAVSPGPGGTVNVFVTQVDIYGSVPPPNSGAIHKYTVSSTGALISGPTTLVPNLNFPEGIAVSSDGKTVYVVIPQTFSNFNVGEIDAYDTTTGIGAPLIKNMSGVPWDIAVSASNLFVTLSTANAVGEYNFNTGVYNPSFISGSGSNADLNYPRGIALGVGGPCMGASTLSVVVSKTVSEPYVEAFVPKGSWKSSATGFEEVVVEPPNSGVPTFFPTTAVVNSCASNSDTKETVCTANDNTVYVISGLTIHYLHSAGSGMITFSGGGCTNCEVTMDSTNNKALIGLSLPWPGSGGYRGGFQYLDLDTLTFENAFLSNSPFFSGLIDANISEGILIDPVRNLILSPDENGVYELVQTKRPATAKKGSGFFENDVNPGGLTQLDSAAEDCATGIALASTESYKNPPVVYIADLTRATLTGGLPGTWTAPSQLQTLSGTTLVTGGGGIMVAQGTHTGVVADEFGGQNIIAIALPTANTGTPTIQDWVGCGVASGFQLGYDPHTVTAYQTPFTSSDGTFHAIALLGNTSANTLARVDLTSMLDTSIVPRDASGHFCAGGPLTNYPGIVTLIGPF